MQSNQSLYVSLPSTTDGSSHPFHVAVAIVDPATIAPADFPMKIEPFFPVHAFLMSDEYWPFSMQLCSQKVLPPSIYIMCGFHVDKASLSFAGNIPLSVLLFDPITSDCLMDPSAKSNVVASRLIQTRSLSQSLYLNVSLTISLINFKSCVLLFLPSALLR